MKGNVNVEKLERFASVKCVESTEYKDIFLIRMKSPAFNPLSTRKLIDDNYQITHVSFESKTIEYTYVSDE